MRRVLVLASASPRRERLLGWLGVPFDIDPASVDESPRDGEIATDMVRRLAHAKGNAVAARRAADWVLAADTTVELDGVLFGKPDDAADAARMLAQLGGREHRVATGFALLAPGGTVRAADVVVTRVRFRPLDARAIAAYVATGECEGKAGAYAIQGHGAGLIDRIDGSFTNVIGLPLVETTRALAEAGLLGR
jgi:septum formation protein